MCEPQLADFFATRGDWEFASLEIGINMLGQFTTPQFKERASYLIQTILDKNPGKPVVVITPYPNQHHYKIDETDISRRQRDYTAFLKEFVDDSNNENLHIIDGFDILTDFCGHNIDLVHPFDTGMTQMGENLAKALANIHGIKALLDDLK
jgi:lysophospholipase L1-like esterase